MISRVVPEASVDRFSLRPDQTPRRVVFEPTQGVNGHDLISCSIAGKRDTEDLVDVSTSAFKLRPILPLAFVTRCSRLPPATVKGAHALCAAQRTLDGEDGRPNIW